MCACGTAGISQTALSALLSHGSCHTSETVSVSMCVRLLEQSPNTLRSDTSNCTSLPFNAPHMVTRVPGTIQSLQDIKSLHQELQCSSDLVDFNSSLDMGRVGLYSGFHLGLTWPGLDLGLHSQDVRLLVCQKWWLCDIFFRCVRLCFSASQSWESKVNTQ